MARALINVPAKARKGDVLLAHAAVDRVRSEIVLETLREDQLLDLRY